MRRFATGLLILISSLCLFVSSTSLWVRHNVVNTEVFVSNVETIVDLPPVQERVTTQVTQTVMSDPRVQSAIDSAVSALPPGLQQFKPTVTNGVQSLVSTGVSRLLAAQPFRPLVTSALTTAHQQLVNGQPVQFTLGQAKARVPESAKSGLAGQVLDLLPNDVGITLLTPASAPRLYNAVDLLKSLWWWVGLIALGTLAGALGISRHRRGTLRAWGVTTSVFALIALVALRVARGQVVVAAAPENRDAVGAVYDVLANSLRHWTLWLLALALFVVVETLVWGRLGLVAGVRRGYRAGREEMRRRSARHAAAAAAAGGAVEGAGGELPEGAAATGVPAGPQPWYRRLAAGTRAFADGLDLPQRTERLGGFVAAHFGPARWLGVGIGAVTLLFWPAPTLSVLIWIAAAVALWVGLLEWLRAQAPAPAPTAETAAGAPPVGQVPALPVARPSSDGMPVARPAAESVAVPAGAAPAPRPTPDPEIISGFSGRLDLLVRLGEAHDAGLLSDEEFAQEKNRLLAV